MADNENELVAPAVSPDAAEASQAESHDDAAALAADGGAVTSDDAAQRDAAASARVTGAPAPLPPAGQEVRAAEGALPPVGPDEPEVPLGAGVSDDWKHITLRQRAVVESDEDRAIREAAEAKADDAERE